MKTTYIRFVDTGHSWLKVSLDELSRLEIGDKITTFSYLYGNHAYLEEDCDMDTFLKKKEARGEKVRIVDKLSTHSRVRNYGYYKKESERFVIEKLNSHFLSPSTKREFALDCTIRMLEMAEDITGRSVPDIFYTIVEEGYKINHSSIPDEEKETLLYELQSRYIIDSNVSFVVPMRERVLTFCYGYKNAIASYYRMSSLADIIFHENIAYQKDNMRAFNLMTSGQCEELYTNRGVMMWARNHLESLIQKEKTEKAKLLSVMHSHKIGRSGVLDKFSRDASDALFAA